MRSKSYKSNKNKKGKDSYSKESNGKDFRNAKLNPEGRDNDPNFYFTNAELAQQAGQLSFQNVLGLGGIDNYKIPSINKIYLNPCPGITVSGYEFYGDATYNEMGSYVDVSDEKRGINLMSSKLYTMLSTFTGRTSNYAPQDVAMMVLAISSIAELSETIRRCFGIALTYNPRNRNLPLGLLRTMGLNVTDFLANIPAYRMRFNIAMTRINQIPLLDNIAYIRKSREIYQRIYMDSMSPMAQIFYYMPYSVWKLDETTDPQGSMLKEVTTFVGSDRQVNLSVWLDDLESMITALLESSTLNLIYADLLNMANKIKVPVWQFDYLAENYVVMPEYNRNASLQYHHTRVMSPPLNYLQDGAYQYRVKRRWRMSKTLSDTLETNVIEFTSGNVVVSDPDTNNIVYNPVFIDRTYTKTVVDMDNPMPTLEDKIEALRFSVASSGAKIARYNFTTAYTDYDYLQWSPALPDHYVVYDIVYDNVDYTASTLIYSWVQFGVLVGTISANLVIDREKFHNHPMLYILDGSSPDNIKQLTGDLDFYTTVDYEYLKRVNELMYTGLFDFRV